MVKMEFTFTTGRRLDQTIDTSRIKQRGAAFNAMNNVTFLQKEFCKVGTILTGDAGYKGNFFSFSVHNSS